MKLLSLELAGFKSFAEPTEFKFDSGITGIVGPNGCGKSNVVDAVKWVLGEMSAKSLRGEAMLDVIFNGSANRKPMGMAEVSLLFSNEDRRLPIDAQEVKITRRLYRDLTSEYLVNNQTARLKDIRELFLDTGIGVDAYSLIEQGRVSALLDSNGQQRREIFEEAAGISRFKARKKETLRKLEKTDQNLAQSQLVLDEVQRQLRSVKVQAGRARSYQEYAEKLAQLRRSHSLFEYHQLHTKLSSVGAQRADASDALAHEKRELDESRRRQQELQLEIDAVVQTAREAERELAALQAQLQSLQQQAQFARQQHTQLARQQQLIRQRHEEVTAKLAGASELIAQRIGAEAAAEEILTRSRHELSHQTQQQESFARRMAELNREVENDKSRAMDLMRQLARGQSQFNAQSVTRQNIDRQLERLASRTAELQEQISQCDAQVAQLALQRDELVAAAAVKQQEIQEIRARQQANNQRTAELMELLGRRREHRSALVSRRNTLTDLQRRREGVAQPVQELLKRRDSNQGFACVQGMIGDLIDADVQTAPLIEAALGEMLNAVVVESADLLCAQAQDWRQLAGRVRVICLDQLPPYRHDAYDTRHIPDARCAVDLIQYQPLIAPLVLRLLGRTLVVDTLEQAIALQRSGPRNYRYVTRNAEVLNADGVLEIGDGSRKLGTISRRGELSKLAAEIAQTESEIAELTAQAAECDQQARQLGAGQQSLRDALFNTQTTHAQVNAQWQHSGQQADKLRGQQPLIAVETQHLHQQAAQCDQAVESLKHEIVTGEQTLKELETSVQQRLAQLQQQRDTLAEISEQTTRLRVAMGQAQEQRAAAARELAQAQQSHRDTQSQLAHLDEDLAGVENSLGETSRAAAAHEQNALAAGAKLGDAQAAVEENARRLAALRGNQQQINQDLGSRQAQVDSLAAQEHALSLSENELSVRLETLVERTAEEAGVNLVELHTDYTPPENVDFTAMAAEIDDLKARMSRLGNVNLDAINELSQLEERETFLTAQIADIVDAKRQLEELIGKIDDDSRVRFQETFSAIRTQFQEMFRKLFGGGKADVVLENPDDILESGIEIMARPPGKELQSISLLSGGEKAMTAIALVMSIFKSKPSPFCILDEVDAPLDEANTGRFAAIVQEFNAHSQFVVITHNKRMMAVANLLYGVTMQEQGVSKRVAVRFDNRNAAAPAPEPATQISAA